MKGPTGKERRNHHHHRKKQIALKTPLIRTESAHKYKINKQKTKNQKKVITGRYSASSPDTPSCLIPNRILTVLRTFSTSIVNNTNIRLQFGYNSVTIRLQFGYNSVVSRNNDNNDDHFNVFSMLCAILIANSDSIRLGKVRLG